MSASLSRHLRTGLVARDLAASRPRSEPAARQAPSDRPVGRLMAVPTDLLFMPRAFVGVGNLRRTLDERIIWHAAVERTGEEHPLARPARALFPGKLPIQVTEEGRTKLNLVSEAAAADNLMDLVPENLRPGLEAHGIRLRSIAEEARRSANAPAEVFSAEDGARSARAWPGSSSEPISIPTSFHP